MKKLSRLLFALMAVLMLTGVFAQPLTAYAATISDLEEYKDWKGEIKNSMPQTVGGTAYTATNVDALITLLSDSDAAYDSIRDEAIVILDARGAAKKAASDTALEKIDEISDSVGLGADLEGGGEWLSDEAKELIQKIMGFVTILALSAVGIFTAVDVMFLVVPPLHTALEEKAAAQGTTDKAGNPKPRIVSTDASMAWHDAAETGKNVLIIYLKKRLVAYIAIAIVAYMLLSGNLTMIISLVLKLIKGALDSISGI